MNKDNHFVVIWMFVGMLLGLSIGCGIGIFQGSLGTAMQSKNLKVKNEIARLRRHPCLIDTKYQTYEKD